MVYNNSTVSLLAITVYKLRYFIRLFKNSFKN